MTPERFSAAVVIAAIFFGAGLTAFNIGRYDAQQRISCKALRPLTLPMKGALP